MTAQHTSTRKPRRRLPYDNEIHGKADDGGVDYDNHLHGWAEGPPPSSPLSPADRKRIPSLLKWLRQGDRGKQSVLVFPWVRRVCGKSESTAVVLSRALYWAEPQRGFTDKELQTQQKQLKYKRQPRQQKRMRGELSYWDHTGIRASDREIARQTGLSPSVVNDAMRRLQGDKFDPGERKWKKGEKDAVPLIHVREGQNHEGRIIELNIEAVAAAYHEVTKDPVAENEYGANTKSPPDWSDSETRLNATRITTVLNPQLKKLTGDPLAARALHQMLHNFNSKEPKKALRQGWWHTTVKRLGNDLGVSEDAAAKALKTLEKKRLIFRKTWRGRSPVIRARSKHTLLAPNINLLMAKLIPKARPFM